MMKIFSLFSITAALALLVSCEKSMTEAERNAQVEAEVQQRLAAERQSADLAQRQADLDAREQALADQEAATANKTTAVATPRPTARPQATADTRSRVSSAERGAAKTYDTFYRKLEPHGAWRETADYGYVYQPKKAQQRDWRPYTDGSWAYTDAGWTWVSDEPFGWATYHYGRWTRFRGVGWVWVPGDEWAPAWVSWRKSDEHVGWAPLPPEARFERGKGIKKWADSYYDIGADEYVFIPNEDIGSNEIRRAIVPVEQNVTIVNRTTNVTNITYSNTTVVNEGPDYEELRGQSRQPLRRLRLERQYEVEQDESPQAAVRGDVIAMMTPLFSGRSSERPRNVGAPIQQATVERNWATSGNQPEAERARQKMKAEATPPPDAPSKKFEKPAIAESGSTPPVAAATATPVATAAPEATAPSPTPAATAVATPTPAASITPRATTTPIPVATATATPIATATPTVTPAATARPSATPSPTVTATATATPTPIATPRATSTPLAIATPTPRPIATPAVVPSATPADEIATSPTPPAATRRTTPVAPIVPVITPTPATSLSPAVPDATGGAEDSRQKNAAERAERLRQRDDARNAKIREMAGGASPSVAPVPAATPRLAPTPAPAVVTEPVQAPAEATPVTRKAARMPAEPLATPPAALTTPAPEAATATSPAASASSSPGLSPAGARRDKKPKRALEPGGGTDEPETPEATPAGGNVP